MGLSIFLFMAEAPKDDREVILPFISPLFPSLPPTHTHTHTHTAEQRRLVVLSTLQTPAAKRHQEDHPLDTTRRTGAPPQEIQTGNNHTLNHTHWTHS